MTYYIIPSKNMEFSYAHLRFLLCYLIFLLLYFQYIIDIVYS